MDMFLRFSDKLMNVFLFVCMPVICCEYASDMLWIGCGWTVAGL